MRKAYNDTTTFKYATLPSMRRLIVAAVT
ncbi:hypothetical protein EYZ11_011582 [Aspergillus tanneri]|uniref:Uncharacterized protein n=1 Tax=Aspergillus tanneri TaxID=1220188 RepID=A0A4S3J4J4_9EURO|nr:hypothetical protein EYZ11_011582 [Aspergillus tanneri]